MVFESTQAADICRQTDALFKNQKVKKYSLSPVKEFSTDIYELGEQLFSETKDIELSTLFCQNFSEIIKAQLYHFPENIFWDTDYLFFSVFKEISQNSSPQKFLKKYTETMLRLLAIFGYHSNIKFRYLHDFTYGFDWAKWVKKDKKNRKEVHPFSLEFLERMFNRGKELEILIKENDAKYHQLEAGQQFRNPFLFLREPKEEQFLLNQLASTDLIPIKTWETDCPPIWQKYYEAERNKISLQLGISK